MKYWKAICRYGHVGKGKEVSVARYLVTGSDLNCIEAWDIAKGMPGVKSNGVFLITSINRSEWLLGKQKEKENFYVQNLFNLNSRKAS